MPYIYISKIIHVESICTGSKVSVNYDFLIYIIIPFPPFIYTQLVKGIFLERQKVQKYQLGLLDKKVVKWT